MRGLFTVEITTKELIAHAGENIDIDARLVNSHTRWLDYVNAVIRDMDPKYYDNVEDRFKDLAFSLIEILGEATTQITNFNNALDQKDDDWDNYVDDIRAEYDDRIADLETELAEAREEED